MKSSRASMVVRPHNIHIILSSISLFALIIIPETANALITQARPTPCCYFSPPTSVSKHRYHQSSTEVRSIQLGKNSIPCDTNDGNEDRRSVLRKGTIGASSAFIIATTNIRAAEAKQPAPTTFPSNRRTTNFPRVYPGLKIGNVLSEQVCEIFVDLACPYSRKIFNTVWRLPPTYTDQMVFVYHNVIQPWHHQSLWLHESTFAVKILYPEFEAAYWKALFEDAPRWYDKEIYGWTRGEFYDQIASFAANVVVSDAQKKGGDDVNTKNTIDDVSTVKKRILQYLIPPQQPGGNFPDEAKILLGSAPDDDENAVFPLTQQIVKFQRKRGVHITPTCFFNGIEQNQISSSWEKKEWTIFLDQALS